MEGILKAIGSFFRKKKDEELVPPQQPQIKPITTPSIPAIPIPTPVPTITGKPINPIKSITDYFEPTPQVRARDIIRELPGAVVKVATPILQSIPRAIAETAMSTGFAPSQEMKPEGVSKIVFGEEPLTPVWSKKRLRGKLEKAGLPPLVAAGIGIPLSVASTALNLPGVNLPLGKVKDEAKPVIESADELMSVISNEFKKEAGDELRVPIVDFFKDFSKRFNISDEILDQLDEAPITGDNFSIEKTGKYLEFIFDEGFRPLKNVMQNLRKPVTEAVKEEAEQVIPKVKELDWDKATPEEITEDIFKNVPSDVEKKVVKKTTELPKEVIEPAPEYMKESEFNKVNKEVNAFLKEDYGLQTPAQYAKTQVRNVAEQEKAQLKNVVEASKEFGENLVSAEGKGGIKVPFSDLDYTNWKDKDILLLNRETPMRNIEEVAGKDAPKVKEFLFDRINQATQDLENFVRTTKMGIEDTIINKLGIEPNSAEDKLIMQFGEGKINKEQLIQASPTKWQQVMEADQYFRTLYDDILTKINDTITKYGYDPVLRRNDYYTHYQEIGNVFQQLGNITRSEQLPAWLNGLTADFKPGKQFFKFAQPRLGGDYTESAIGAFENYLYPASRQIYYTDSIQRGRALWNTLADAIQKNEDLPPTHLSDFMAWLNDRVNILSGKKSLMARGTEGMIGRKAYGVVNAITKQTSANLVAGNVSASMTNFIPLTQGFATTDKPSFIKGLINAVLNPLTEDNNYMIDGVQSSFLRRRFPYRELSQTLWQSASEKLGWLFSTIDKFTANTVTAGKYFEGIADNLAPEEAMKVADEYAARLMADRSFGQMPTMFENQGLLKLMTMFQLEINNQLSFIFKDAAKYAGSEGNLAKSAATLAEIALYSHVFNNIFEWATGRRPAFDPIYIVLKSYDTWANGNGSVSQKANQTAKVVMDNLPFLSIFTGGGRIPILAGIPTVQDIQESPLKALAKFGLTYFPPAGGYQAYKTLEGMEGYIRGYSQTPGGRVKYPIEKDFDNLVRSALFGQYSSPEANKYFEGGETALGEKQAQIFKMLHKEDPNKAVDYYNRIHLQRDINSKITALKTTVEGMKDQLTNPATSVAAKEKINNMAIKTKTEIVQMLSQIPETNNLIDIIFGKLSDVIKAILGGGKVEASEVEGLVPAGTKTPASTPATVSNLGISAMVGKTPKTGVYMGMSNIVAKSPVKGAKIKKGSFKKFTPKKLGIKLPTIKTTPVQTIKPIMPIKKPIMKLKVAPKNNTRKGIRIGKIKRPFLKSSRYI